MDTRELLIQAREGHAKAREQVICENAGLVYHVAKRFRGRGQELEDLIQVGYIGLMKAVDHFNLEMEVKFSTYAVPLIIGEIKRFLRDDGMLRVSRSLKETAARLYRRKEELERATGQEVGLSELAQALGISREEATEALGAVSQVESLSQPAAVGKEGRELLLEELLACDRHFDEELISRLALDKVLQQLEAREQYLIRERYFGEKTQAEVAAGLGISQVQVSRLEKKILHTLRAALGV